MAIKSMTGFARAAGAMDPLSWHWEVRSVNGRGLDIRLRFPPGFEALEPQVREAIGTRIARGSVAVNLSVKRAHGDVQIQLNSGALRQVLEAVEQLRASVALGPPSAEGLLGIKGVLEFVEPEESDQDTRSRTQAMLATLREALDQLVLARAEEGRRLQAIVLDQLTAIEGLIGTIARLPARSPEAVKQRLKEQVSRLLDSGAPLDEARLYQEAALLATRADTEEELKRLAAHVAAARQLLQAPDPSGRRLDFLAQEFNREANTLCSKANDVDTTRAGLELKAIIDQMREQVQNVE
jgi:uncharacterized protein (TIGR00255 family)